MLTKGEILPIGPAKETYREIFPPILSLSKRNRAAAVRRSLLLILRVGRINFEKRDDRSLDRTPVLRVNFNSISFPSFSFFFSSSV